jgi:adenylylsulfate kinase-like enzyme
VLIVLRGNSGSGKSTVAKLLRDTAIAQGSTSKIALIEQDYLRRIVLKEKETTGGDNIDLIAQTVRFALSHNYHVILEGILNAAHYRTMLEQLQTESDEHFFYYFDVPFDETLKRHATKPNAHEFGEAEMRKWYAPQDLLGLDEEQLIPASFSREESVTKILTDTAL